MITENKIDKKRHLSEDVSRRKEDITGFEEDKREHLIFLKTIRRDRQKKTFKNENMKI